MANPGQTIPVDIPGAAANAAVDQPGEPEAVANATFEGLKETVEQAAEFAKQALDLTGQALGQAVDVASDKAFQQAANVGSNIATPAATQMAHDTFSWSGYVQALGIMCLLLALLWFGVWALRRYGRFNFLPRPGALPRDSLVMEAQMPLGPRKGLMVVRFMNRRLLLGVTEHQISLLTEDKTGNERENGKFEGYFANARHSDNISDSDPD